MDAVNLAVEIRRGVLLIVGAIRRHCAVDESRAAVTLAEILEAAADGIKSRYLDKDA